MSYAILIFSFWKLRKFSLNLLCERAIFPMTFMNTIAIASCKVCIFVAFRAVELTFFNWRAIEIMLNRSK